jgi:O-antigen ligase
MKSILRAILWLEPVALFVVMAAFWTPDLNRVHTLWLMLPILVARVVVSRRLIPASALNGAIIALLLLMLLNLVVAPYSWSAWIIGRPIAGALLATSLAERVRRLRQHGWSSLLNATLVLCFGVGIAALLYSQWTIKSIQMQPIIDLIPPPPAWAVLENTFGAGFNVNEIGGAMAWLCPLAAAIAIADFQAKRRRAWWALAAFIIVALALFLGQSRFGILGVIGALVLVIFGMMPPGRARVLALGAVAAALVVEIVIVTGLLNPAAEQAALRDEASFSARVYIWESGLAMVRDHPLTGIGMNQFRARAVRALYPVPGYETAVLPHAHNEWIQIGADLGLPGIAALLGLYGVAFWRLVSAYRSGHKLAVGIAAGLAAHLFFGIGDAITLYDRFSFVFWWLVGLTMSLDIMARQRPSFLEQNALQSSHARMEIDARMAKGVPV